MTNWTFYNAVRAWVAQHPPKPPNDGTTLREILDRIDAYAEQVETGTDPPDAKR